MPEKARRSSFFHLILRNDREKMITPSQLATMLRIVSMMSTVFPTPAPPDVELLQDLDIHRFSAPCRQLQAPVSGLVRLFLRFSLVPVQPG